MAGPAVVGRVALDCPCCPWPVHLSMLADPSRPVPEGSMPYVLDAEAADVEQAVRIHGRQHGIEYGSEDEMWD